MSGLAATLARRRRAGAMRRARGRGPARAGAMFSRLPRSLPALSPRLRRRVVALLVLSLVLAGGYQFWLRDSSLVAVHDVKISGLTTADAPSVRSALAHAAKQMTTLNVDQEQLARSVEAYPVVRDIQIARRLPHGLNVRVIEHVPAAMAVGDSGQVAVAADGTILRGLPVEGELPTVAVEGTFGGDRLRDSGALAAAAVAGAAPTVLRGRIEEVARRTDQGLVAELREGPELIFGAATQLRAKWAAAARVLADKEAQGASYIDLRIAGRPAAGGLPAQTVTPVAPAGTAAPPVAPPGAADPSTTTAPADPTLPADPAAQAPPGATTTPPPTTTVPPTTTTVPPATAPAPAAPTPAPAPVPGGGVEGGVAAPTTP